MTHALKTNIKGYRPPRRDKGLRSSNDSVHSTQSRQSPHSSHSYSSHNKKDMRQSYPGIHNNNNYHASINRNSGNNATNLPSALNPRIKTLDSFNSTISSRDSSFGTEDDRGSLARQSNGAITSTTIPHINHSSMQGSLPSSPSSPFSHVFHSQQQQQQQQQTHPIPYPHSQHAPPTPQADDTASLASKLFRGPGIQWSDINLNVRDSVSLAGQEGGEGRGGLSQEILDSQRRGAERRVHTHKPGGTGARSSPASRYASPGSAPPSTAAAGDTTMASSSSSFPPSPSTPTSPSTSSGGEHNYHRSPILPPIPRGQLQSPGEGTDRGSLAAAQGTVRHK